ncbi:MAG: hypothetical protein JSR18_07115 [Proteobacteria bacterium]|nr:hypothetical protein [Pseudomonadota bacterium]
MGTTQVRAKVKTYFCPVQFPENPRRSRMIFSSKGYETTRALRANVN